MRHKKLFLILILSTGIFVIASLWGLHTWSKHIVVGIVEDVEPPICTQSVVSSDCGDGVLTIRTEDGAVSEYKYAPGRSKSGNLNITALPRGTKIELVVSQGRISEAKLVGYQEDHSDIYYDSNGCAQSRSGGIHPDYCK